MLMFGKILIIVHFLGGKWAILNRLKVLHNSYLSLILVLLVSYVLKILKSVQYCTIFVRFCENGRYLANLCLCILGKSSNFALAYKMIKYENE